MIDHAKIKAIKRYIKMYMRRNVHPEWDHNNRCGSNVIYDEDHIASLQNYLIQKELNEETIVAMFSKTDEEFPQIEMMFVGLFNDTYGEKTGIDILSIFKKVLEYDALIIACYLNPSREMQLVSVDHHIFSALLIGTEHAHVDVYSLIINKLDDDMSTNTIGMGNHCLYGIEKMPKKTATAMKLMMNMKLPKLMERLNDANRVS